MDVFARSSRLGGPVSPIWGVRGVVSVGVSATGSRNDLGTDLAVQPNGKIVVGGRTMGASGCDFLLLRLNGNGAKDNGFGTSGVVTTQDRKSTRLNSSHSDRSRMPSSA